MSVLHAEKQDATELDCYQEQHDAAATIPEHADKYVYEPLPGERWIRVLVFEPALELECPLAARLELLALDSHTCQLEASATPVDVSKSKSPYTALSYSWALDDGDDSLSHRLTLSNKQVSITQNLA
ncbi:hypothetical protein CERZMDRAFT_102479 [Cercospora zeae-maydis SCOH1-5]|uniref:Uncharacterized protein n=1 Tax=Cercospora zeae-maydis SCOH1-5 TaxID=717836 RepID=A0A6A6F0A0_9PEZI|nr:hypothetical protein CERZMDRAFT_102479 [Cercospora zeae-maydis SCOH1-5]